MRPAWQYLASLVLNPESRFAGAAPDRMKSKLQDALVTNGSIVH
jgi:hypothetical protein